MLDCSQPVFVFLGVYVKVIVGWRTNPGALPSRISSTDGYSGRTTDLPHPSRIASSHVLIQHPQWDYNLQWRGGRDLNSATEALQTLRVNLRRRVVRFILHTAFVQIRPTIPNYKLHDPWLLIGTLNCFLLFVLYGFIEHGFISIK